MENLFQDVYDSALETSESFRDLSPKEVWEGAVIRLAPEICIMRNELSEEYSSEVARDILEGDYGKAAEELDLSREKLEENVKNRYWETIKVAHEVYRVEIAGYGPYEGPNSRKAVIVENEDK